eukprot:TRINITY_DN23055_c0_g1_i1.p1 TRINITY_DN23055_c0_g1~~TRINITY_DN23055_c0_g1_i1.p1  ORF type:complete len:220 (-),score=43.84 TRINITY_DN23055_c0_g1_i1:117-719(-)
MCIRDRYKALKMPQIKSLITDSERTKTVTKAEKKDVPEEDPEEIIRQQIKEFEKQFPDKQFEEKFDDSVPVVRSYDWIKQYKPRKPQYVNKVKTGYEWNKYNQTHFDQDNLPPKVVQGYKFNIFYPDLVDKAITPQYYLEMTDNPDYCTIRFSAGPPYEDIAFKILNREWETNDKHGFVSIFEKGILHLYFNFRRIRYRR